MPVIKFEWRHNAPPRFITVVTAFCMTIATALAAIAFFHGVPGFMPWVASGIALLLVGWVLQLMRIRRVFRIAATQNQENPALAEMVRAYHMNSAALLVVVMLVEVARSFAH